MSQLPSPYPAQGYFTGYPEQRERDTLAPTRRDESGSVLGLPGWAVAGLAVAAVGALAWYSFGPDIRRYLKIRSM